MPHRADPTAKKGQRKKGVISVSESYVTITNSRSPLEPQLQIAFASINHDQLSLSFSVFSGMLEFFFVLNQPMCIELYIFFSFLYFFFPGFLWFQVCCFRLYFSLCFWEIFERSLKLLICYFDFAQNFRKIFWWIFFFWVYYGSDKKFMCFDGRRFLGL